MIKSESLLGEVQKGQFATLIRERAASPICKRPTSPNNAFFAFFPQARFFLIFPTSPICNFPSIPIFYLHFSFNPDFFASFLQSRFLMCNFPTIPIFILQVSYNPDFYFCNFPSIPILYLHFPTSPICIFPQARYCIAV